jgi:hypothetical protein
MVARTLGNPTPRHLTLEDRVNMAEGEDLLSSSDGGFDVIPGSKDAGPVQDASFAEYMDDPGLNQREAVAISSDDAAGESLKQKARGERVVFTDDEDSDHAFKKFKQRNTVKRKQEATQRAKTKMRASKNTMVGGVPKNVLEAKRRKERHYDDPSGDDEA